MASKENEEREHPGDKKTGVKLIYQGQEKKVIIVSTVRSSLIMWTNQIQVCEIKESLQRMKEMEEK